MGEGNGRGRDMVGRKRENGRVKRRKGKIWAKRGVGLDLKSGSGLREGKAGCIKGEKMGWEDGLYY